MRRLQTNVDACIAAEGWSKKIQFLRKAEQKHALQFFKQPLSNLQLLTPHRDADRLQVLVWMEERLKEVLYLISERKLFDSI